MFRSTYRNTLRPIFGFTFVLIFFFMSAEPAWACTPPPPVTNYWYKLNYEIPTELLPPGINVSVTYPTYPTTYGDTYNRDIHLSALGRVVFTNRSGRTLYILPSDAIYRVDQYRGKTSDYAQNIVKLFDSLAQSNPSFASTLFNATPSFYNRRSNSNHSDSLVGFDLRQTFEVHQSPGGITSPPPVPSVYELVLLHDDRFYRIPFAVTFTLNPNYNENIFASDAPLSDYMISSDNIVLGEVIGAAPDSQLLDFSSSSGFSPGTYVEGTAHVAVEEWIFGEGPDEIYVGHFVTPELFCGGTITVGESAYFILRGSGMAVTDDIPQFGHYKRVGSDRDDSRDQIASALAKSKGVLLDQVMSIFMPILHHD